MPVTKAAHRPSWEYVAIEDVFEGKTIDGHGESITYKVGPRRAGTYKFLCTKHPFMDGTLVVK